MVFTINTLEYTHLTEQSCYNNNYYQHNVTNEIIFEHCDDNGGYTLYKVINGEEIFLGGAYEDMESGKIIEVNSEWI